MPRFQIIDQCLERNASPHKDRDATEDLRVGVHGGFFSFGSRIHKLIVPDLLRTKHHCASLADLFISPWQSCTDSSLREYTSSLRQSPGTHTPARRASWWPALCTPARLGSR